MYGHHFNWSSPKILHRKRHTKRREIAEVIFILKNDDSINLKKDIENLSLTYHGVIEAI